MGEQSTKKMSGTALKAWGCALAIVAAILSYPLNNNASAKKSAAKRPVRKWRIIVNDDGEVRIPGKNLTLQEFLMPKFNDLKDTQVDAIFLCLGSTDRYVAPEVARMQDTMNQWAHDGRVAEQLNTQIRTYIEAARNSGMDIFLSVRMNDIHDAWKQKLSYPLKVKRRDLLIGKARDFSCDTLMSAHWSGFDWSKPEVQKHFLDFIEWCCRQYDFDGVELDWFRHPLMFKLGEERQNIKTMNNFIRKVRRSLDSIAKARKKQYLLTVRTMDTPRMCLRTGLDVEQWLKEGGLDMLMIGGGYMPYGARLKEFIDMAHRYGVPAYPTMNHFKDPEMMRSVASNFFALGADGFYIFNWYGVPDKSEKAKCLTQCGSSGTLTGLDKRYVADNGCRIRYCGYANAPSQFPSPLISGRSIELVVGDDVATAQQHGSIGRMILRMTVSDIDGPASLHDLINGFPSSEYLSVQVNGVQLPRNAVMREGPDAFVAPVAAPPLRQGLNHIRIFPGLYCSGSLKSAIKAMEVVVDYKPIAEEPIEKLTSIKFGLPSNHRTIEAATGMPLSLYKVPVGSKRTVTFNIKIDPKEVEKAQLGLTVEDFDSREEVKICFNGEKDLMIPDVLLSDKGYRMGFIDVPLHQLRPGKNLVEFTFTSNLCGTTQGFNVAEALMVLRTK